MENTPIRVIYYKSRTMTDRAPPIPIKGKRNTSCTSFTEMYSDKSLTQILSEIEKTNLQYKK